MRLSKVAFDCRRLPFNLVPCHNVALLQGFDGVQAARLLVLGKQHLQGKEKLPISFQKIPFAALRCLQHFCISSEDLMAEVFMGYLLFLTAASLGQIEQRELSAAYVCQRKRHEQPRKH